MFSEVVEELPERFLPAIFVIGLEALLKPPGLLNLLDLEAECGRHCLFAISLEAGGFEAGVAVCEAAAGLGAAVAGLAGAVAGFGAADF